MAPTTINPVVMRNATQDVVYDVPDIPVYVKEECQSKQVRHSSVPHWHEGVELIHVLGGGMRCCINDVVLDLRPGDFCFINRRQMHVADSGSHHDFNANVVVADLSLLTRNESVLSRYVNPVIEEEGFTHFHLSGANGTAAELGTLVDEIADLQTRQPEAFELTVVGLIHLAFQRIYLAYTQNLSQLEPVDQDATIQRKMSNYIYEHFQEKIGLDDIANAGNVSRSKCSKVFKHFLQKSPIDFLNLYRLEVASRLLTSSSESIAHIATSCGFSQQSYFNRMFGRTYGCTPREYRERFAASAN